MKVKEVIEKLKSLDRDDEEIQLMAYIHREQGINNNGDWAFLDYAEEYP